MYKRYLFAVDRLRHHKNSLLALVAVVLVVGLFAWYQLVVAPEKLSAALAARTAPAITVSTEPATLETWQDSENAIATLEASYGVDVASEVNGVVTAIHFESGQRVSAGAPLVQLDDRVLQAELKEVRAQLDKAELALDRISRLANHNMASKSDRDAARSLRDEAAGAVERVEAKIAQKSIRAPFDGRLGVRLVTFGEYVEAGTAIVTLQQARTVYANFHLPEAALARVEVGDPVELQVDSYPGQVFPGHVSSLDPKVDARSRTFLVQATLDNKEMKLVPGQYANVRILSGRTSERVMVPETAVQFSLWGDTVYVVTPGEKEPRTVEQRVVQVEAIEGGRVSLSGGVAAGEEVVTIGGFKLRNGAAVRINNDFQPPAAGMNPRY